MKKPVNKTRNMFTLILFTTLTAQTGISMALVAKVKENHFKMLPKYLN